MSTDRLNAQCLLALHGLLCGRWIQRLFEDGRLEWFHEAKVEEARDAILEQTGSCSADALDEEYGAEILIDVVFVKRKRGNRLDEQELECFLAETLGILESARDAVQPNLAELLVFCVRHQTHTERLFVWSDAAFSHETANLFLRSTSKLDVAEIKGTVRAKHALENKRLFVPLRRLGRRLSRRWCVGLFRWCVRHGVLINLWNVCVDNFRFIVRCFLVRVNFCRELGKIDENTP